MAIKLTIGGAVKRRGPGNRARSHIEYLKQVAPVLRRLRAEGTLTVADTARALNDTGIMNAVGRPWTLATMHLALKRGGELGLGVRPQSTAEAGRDRSRWIEAARKRVKRV